MCARNRRHYGREERKWSGLSACRKGMKFGGEKGTPDIKLTGQEMAYLYMSSIGQSTERSEYEAET